jgi:cell wall-associated NlpC family hydrolase
MRKITYIAIIAFFVSGCTSSPRYYKQRVTLSKTQRQNIKYVAMSYLGFPYRYGGQSKNGFDCSGLVCHIYYEATGIKLLHSTKEHYISSVEIPPVEALTGDLVFFNINRNFPDHVGLMLNKKEFIHASKSKGVIISNLDDKYYRKRFLSVRRLKRDLIMLSYR